MPAPSPIVIEFSVDAQQAQVLDWVLRNFPKDYEKIVYRALKRAGKSGVTVCKRAIGRELGIKQADLVKEHRFGARGSQSTGKAIRMSFDARPEGSQIKIQISGRRIPVVWFKPKQLWKSRRTAAARELGSRARQRVRSGVSWKIGKGARVREKMAFYGRGRKGGRAADAMATLEAAYTGQPRKRYGVKELGASGHVGVFKRWPPGSKRLPIAELHGPSIPYVAEKNIALQHALDVDVMDVLAKRLDHEIDRLLERKVKS